MSMKIVIYSKKGYLSDWSDFDKNKIQTPLWSKNKRDAAGYLDRADALEDVAYIKKHHGLSSSVIEI